MILKPIHLKTFGVNISLGDYVTLICSSNKKIELSTWQTDKLDGEIEIGNYVLISPGSVIRAAEKIVIKESSMIASDVIITDSDWHGIYDRALPVGKSEKVILEDNVWIGDGSIVSKGVTIGKNSIVGARSVVIKDVPENVIVAGNPATIVKELDESEKMISRADMFSSPEELDALYLKIDRISLKENSFLGWVKSKFLPGKKN